MALMVNNKKVLGYALGENKYLDGAGIENLNAFVIESEILDNVDHTSFTIDMTKYFNQADANYSDVKYYQILLELHYKEDESSLIYEKLLTPLLKRGEINNKQSGNNPTAAGVISVLFTDKNKLAVRTKCVLDYMPNHPYKDSALTVYGFTSQDIGSTL